MTMTYTVSAAHWWLLFAWGALGWLGAGGVALIAERVGRDLKAAARFWHDRAVRPRATMFPAPPERERDWRDSHLLTQVSVPGSPNRAPTRSFTPAEVRAAHIASRK